jgi:poly(3-hydroxybutyrate) depolymerase
MAGRTLRRILLTAVVIAALAAIPTPGYAATLTQVGNFGSNPGNLAMYSYRPDGLPTGAPLVVALHGCTQNAADYFGHAGWQKYADLWHFALVFPEQKSANNANSCFNWFQSGDTARGQGEALSIRQMVAYALDTWGMDPTRTFVTGTVARPTYPARTSA